ncbi:hypothetical protein C479_04407 [Halovivax asiaticus JCM 14624]|uniref:DUF7343 domain-containing protein n=1 Tax=Halovivax asiaticus JCM 14624 TaxID=1227490 RepID=M0BQH7_9EURY|nr:hypothetical protein [Halovivax asiaticus]ELZ12608.1 hypothetical protein C479_04407 [Halovivax asiaticus JCM 14624]
MGLKNIWSQLSARFAGDSIDESESRPANREADDEETLSYAEQVEYGVDENDLADEDRVLRLLVKRGGRVDRETVIEQTGWTSERLESVVSEMEDDDQISAITVGRQRIICRRGFEPKGYRSHLNE